MSEQQRIFLAVLLCTGIFVGWQLLHPPPPPQPKPAPVASSVVAPTADGAPHGDADAPAAAAGHAAQTAPAAVPQEQRAFKNSVLEGTFTNVDAALSHVQLSQYFESASEAGDTPKPLVLQDPAVPQARVKWSMPTTPGLVFQTGQTPDAASSTVTLAGETAGAWEVHVDITPRPDAYAFDYVLKARNLSGTTQRAGADVLLTLPPHRHPTSGLWRYMPSIFTGSSTRPLSAVCDVDGKVHREDMAKILKAPIDRSDAADWVAIDREYFAVAVVPTGGAAGSCHMRVDKRDAQDNDEAREKGLLEVAYRFAGADVAPAGVWEQRFTVYAGPKKDANLSAVAANLTDVVDYDVLHIPLGFFLARPMVYLLNMFHGWINSWGGAIILLTLVVKLVLFPVSMKSQESTRRMQALKPEMDAIKKKYANDAERQQMEQMKLFRERGINPMGGCLVTLLQLPVWIALYRMLSNAVDLYQQPFLWLPDLTMREPFPILALAMGGLSIVQQKMMPVSMDNAQARMMTYTMPIMFTLFMVALPSGLVVYSLVNIILTIIQQLAINKFASDPKGRT